MKEATICARNLGRNMTASNSMVFSTAETVKASGPLNNLGYSLALPKAALYSVTTTMNCSGSFLRDDKWRRLLELRGASCLLVCAVRFPFYTLPAP